MASNDFDPRTEPASGRRSLARLEIEDAERRVTFWGKLKSRLARLKRKPRRRARGRGDR